MTCLQAPQQEVYTELLGVVIMETLQAFGLVAGSAAESDRYRRQACRKLQVSTTQLCPMPCCWR